MMTFLPFADFALSAAALDLRRLQNQRTEARFVLAWLDDSIDGGVGDLSAYGAARMWEGFRDALGMYYNAMLAEYEARGKTNGPTLPPATFASAGEGAKMPPWLGDERFHASHRAVLLTKDREYYSRHGWAETDECCAPDWGHAWEYLYPHREEDGEQQRWGLYPQSKYKTRTIVAWCHGPLVVASPKPARKSPKREAWRNGGDSDDDIPLKRVCQRSLPSSGGRAPLVAEYTRLTKEALPALARERRWPIRFDHCFQRVVLDHAFGRCWYEALNRKRGPAIQQIATDALERAVACARRLAADDTADAAVVRQLDNQSLLWRGKKPKGGRAAASSL